MRKMQAEVIVVVRLSERHLGNLERALARVFPEDYRSIASYIRCIFPRASPFSHVAESIKGDVVGFVVSILEDRWTGHVLYLGVIPEYRRRGVGEKLLCLTLLDLFKLSSTSKVYLEVSTENRAAINLYLKLGFTITRLVKRYYANGSDCYIMTLLRATYEERIKDACIKSLCQGLDLQSQLSSL